MGLLTAIRELLTIPDQQLQTRSLAQAQIDVFAHRYRSTPWRAMSTREALGVPAVFRAVSLISNTVGQLSMEAYRRGAKLSPDATPRVVMRPNPLTIPQVFHRDTAFYLARSGEVWWYVAQRDGDDLALSVLPVDPREVVVEENPRNPLRPVIRWRDQLMVNEDFRQITLLPDPSNPLRGFGPLQACGAAVSVAVESQEWAANFFGGGGVPSVLLQAAGVIEQEEADALREKWMSRPNNVPRVIDERIKEVEAFGVNPDNAQLTEGRMFQVGEVARMFGIPGPLLEYNASGSSLHYQNDESIWRQFQTSCLTPNYLEPIEQTMSDLLTRSTIARYSLAGLLRADTKTRFEVHGIAIDKGIYDPDEARRIEGLEPGDVENRPIPFAPPQALPTSVPALRSVPMEVRCSGTRLIRGRRSVCNHNFGRLSQPYEVTCPKCKTAIAA